MINFDDYTNENKAKNNSKWPYIPDHPYRILIIGGSESRKTNALLNLINNQPDIDKIYLYAKDPYEAKYKYIIKKNRKHRINDPKAAFIEYSNDMQDICKNINELNSIATELFIRGRKLSIHLVFIRQSYFKVPKDVRLNSTHFFIMIIPNKRELQQIALNHSSDINSKDFIKIYKNVLLDHILIWLMMLRLHQIIL